MHQQQPPLHSRAAAVPLQPGGQIFESASAATMPGTKPTSDSNAFIWKPSALSHQYSAKSWQLSYIVVPPRAWALL